MPLSDVMSHAGLSRYAEIGLVLFMFAFLLIVWRIFRPGARDEHERTKRLPLDDGDTSSTHRPGDEK